LGNLTRGPWSNTPDPPREAESNCFDCGQREIKLYQKPDCAPNQWYCFGCLGKIRLRPASRIDRLRADYERKLSIYNNLMRRGKK